VNIEQAKEISIVLYLARQGYEPVKFLRGEHWYISPLRPGEKVASFSVRENAGYVGEDIWDDFGIGGDSMGGDIIVLAKFLHNCHTVSQALRHLESYGPCRVGNRSKAPNPSPTLFDQRRSNVQLIGSPQPLYHSVILHYLRHKRGLPDELVKKYLSVAWFRTKKQPDKKYFGFCWPNQSGGYEIRGAGENTFKSVVGSKDLSIWPSTAPQSDKAYIFEGMVDYLSALALKRKKTLPGLVIVLNTTNLVKRIVPYLKYETIKELLVFTDNDTAGKETFEVIQTMFPEKTVRKMDFYDDFKDVNDYLVQNRTFSG